MKKATCLALLAALVGPVLANNLASVDKVAADKGAAEKAYVESAEDTQPAVTLTESNKPDANRNTHQDKGSTEPSADDKIASFTERLSNWTFWLTIATATLALISLWQGWMLKKSSDVLPLLERAYVFVDAVQRNSMEPSAAQEGPKGLLSIRFANIGKSPAQILEIGVRYSVSAQIPEAHGGPRAQFPPGYVLKADGKSDPWHEVRITLTSGDLSAISADTKKLYVFGWLKYVDVFGKARNTRFCRALNYSTGDFEIAGDEKLNQWD